MELKGKMYEIGRKQGIALKSNAKWKQQTELQTNGNMLEARKQIEKVSPSLLNEIEGLAAGMNIHVDTAMQLFGGYNIQMPSMGCTTLANDSLYVRNYDFSDALYDARLVLLNPDNSYASIGFSQQITGRLDGMNEKGLVIGLHLVNEKVSQKGFLATTICRMVLEQCADIYEAISLIKQVPHQYCVNFSIMDREGNNAVVEVSPEQQIVYKRTPLICTNHFESKQLSEKIEHSFKVRCTVKIIWKPWKRKMLLQFLRIIYLTMKNRHYFSRIIKNTLEHFIRWSIALKTGV